MILVDYRLDFVMYDCLFFKYRLKYTKLRLKPFTRSLHKKAKELDLEERVDTALFKGGKGNSSRYPIIEFGVEFDSFWKG